MDKKTFKKSIAAVCEQASFIKNGQSWYRYGKDTIGVINLQKSDWGNFYYINLGIWLKGIGDEKFPKENHCQIRGRAEGLFPEARELVSRGCSLEESDPEYITQLSVFLRDQLIPFLEEAMDIEKLRSLIQEGRWRSGSITGDARRFLLLIE